MKQISLHPNVALVSVLSLRAFLLVVGLTAEVSGTSHFYDLPALVLKIQDNVSFGVFGVVSHPASVKKMKRAL